MRREGEDRGLASYNTSPRGIWPECEGDIIWVVDDYDTPVYAMYLWSLKHPEDAIENPYANTLQGIWTDGEGLLRRWRGYRLVCFGNSG